MKAKITTNLLKEVIPSEKPYEIVDTEISGFLLRVQPSGIKTYFCSYRLGGRKTRVKIGSADHFTPQQARSRSKMILAGVAMGEDPAKAREVKDLTIGTFLEKEYGPWLTATKEDKAVATLKRLRVCFSEFMNKPLSSLTTWQLEKWRSQRLRQGRSAATARRDLAPFRAAIRKACRWGCLTNDPFLDLTYLKVPQADKVRFLSEDELTRLMAALTKREQTIREARTSANKWRTEREYLLLPSLDSVTFADHLRPLILISLNTGLRRGELLKLRWSDVTFDSFGFSSINVRAGNSKSGKPRHIPLNNTAKSALLQWRAQNNSESEFVFPGKDGNGFKEVRTSWESVLKVAEITNFRWHDMRHDFASHLVMRGVDLNTVRDLLGHSDIKMTLRYAHLSPAIKYQAVSCLDQPLGFSNVTNSVHNALEKNASG